MFTRTPVMWCLVLGLGATPAVADPAVTGTQGETEALKEECTPAEVSAETLKNIRAEERARAAEEFSAQEAEREKKEEVIKDALVTPVGLYGFLGGGATNFTEPAAVGATDVGGYWDARVGLGTRSIVGAEVGYIGSARNVQALGLANDAYLLGNGVEGIARLNIPITQEDYLLEPYTFAGIGWQHYSVMTDGANTSSISDDDDVMTVPLGVGVGLGFFGVSLDARLTYRQTLDSNMFGTETSSFGDTSMNSWGAGGALGFEF